MDSPSTKIPVIKTPEAGDLVEKNWTYIKDSIQKLMTVSGTVEALRQEVIALRRTIKSGLLDMFPFRIYQLPFFLRTAPDEDKDWRSFRVRGGRVKDIEVSGTDGETDPDTDSFPTVADIIVPAGTAQHFFWIEIGSGVATLHHNDDPTTDGWDSFPDEDAEHALIGWVDTATSMADSLAIIRQIRRTDIMDAGGAGAGGERFKITDDFSGDPRDYFEAIKWSSTLDDFDPDIPFYIAKHAKHRPSLVSDTITGSAVTHVYDDNFHRTTSFGGDSQKEELFPVPETDHIVFCVKLLSPDTSITVDEDSSHPEWFDATPRMWARLKFQEA